MDLDRSSYNTLKVLADLAPNGNVRQISRMQATDASMCPTWNAQHKLGCTKRINLFGRGWFFSTSGVLRGTQGTFHSDHNPKF